MRNRVWSGLLALLIGSGAWAKVVEQPVRFPGDLGGGVLYYDDAVAYPEAGVVVVHEWWGMNDYPRRRARQLAVLGYPAFAVDMYGHGKVAEHAADAKAFMEAALKEPELMQQRFEQARQALATQGRVPRARQFAVGYCFGGAVVLNQARSGADLAGVASFHGSLAAPGPTPTGVVKARILVATGGADPMVPAQQVADFVKEMSEAGASFELISFPGVKHGFTNPAATASGEANGLPLAYDEQADEQSWEALLRFLATR